MGNNFAVKCANCGYYRNLSTGIGMAYVGDRLMDPVDGTLAHQIKSKVEREKVFSLLKDGGDLGKYGHRVLICQACGEFQDGFYYEIEHSGGKHVSKHRCKKCRRVIVPKDDVWYSADLSQFKCPQCGEHSLTEDYSIVIYWD